MEELSGGEDFAKRDYDAASAAAWRQNFDRKRPPRGGGPFDNGPMSQAERYRLFSTRQVN
jgi:hypothetical protein